MSLSMLVTKGIGSDLIQKKFQSNQNIISIKYLILI